MFVDQKPSNEDLKLLQNLKIKDEHIFENLYKIFSYHRPKDYQIYNENIKNYPLAKDKIYLYFITKLQKYEQHFKNKKELFQNIAQRNRNFYKSYMNKKFGGKSVTSKTCRELLNNLLPKYEKKHMTFDEKYLKKNIFNKSGLLTHNLKQSLDFFDDEIRTFGINNSKSVKYVKFFKKLNDIIQNTYDRKTINNYLSIYANKDEELFQLKQERILKANLEKAKRKEINIDKKEIKKLKKLIENLNNRKSENQKSKRENVIYSNKEIGKVKKNENNIRLINLVKKGKFEEKDLDNKFSLRNFNKQSRSFFSDLTNYTNNTTFFNNRNTTSTGYGETKNNINHYNFYSFHDDLLNKLNNNKLKKEKEQLIFKSLAIKRRTLSRNKLNISLFPFIPKINEQDNLINLKTYLSLNNTPNTVKMLKSSSSVPLILNLDSKRQNNNIHVSEEKKVGPIKKKKLKGEKMNIIDEQRKKIPLLYEHLKKTKNVLYLKKKDLAQSSKTYDLLNNIYSKQKTLNLDSKKAPKELYNSYYNMSVAIDRNIQTTDVFKKYKMMLNKNTEQNLELSRKQDEKLKTSHLDLVYTLINQRPVEED